MNKKKCTNDIPISSQAGGDYTSNNDYNDYTNPDEQVLDDDEKKYNYEKLWRRYVFRKRFLIISIITILSIGLIITLSILITNSVKKNRYYYDRLTTIMGNLTEGDVYSMYIYFDFLPKYYKDVRELKTQYHFIKSTYDMMNIYVGHSEVIGAKARKAFYDLYEFDKFHNRWNLEPLLNTPEVVDTLIYGGYFEEVNPMLTQTDYSFYFHSVGDGLSVMETNLPADTNPDTSYIYYIMIRNEYVCFGYQNVEDIRDRFIAYRIDKVYCESYCIYIDIYCQSTKEIYTLKCQI